MRRHCALEGVIGSHVSSVEFCQVVRRPGVFNQCAVSVLSQFCKDERCLDVVYRVVAGSLLGRGAFGCLWAGRSASQKNQHRDFTRPGSTPASLKGSSRGAAHRRNSSSSSSSRQVTAFRTPALRMIGCDRVPRKFCRVLPSCASS